MRGLPLRHSASTVMARLAEPTAARHTRFAIVADPHVSTRASGSPKQFDRTEARFETAIEDINSRGVNAVLSVGDLTKDGAPWDFDRVDDLLSELDAPFLAVPGNHDVPKTFDDHRSASRGRFVDRYTPGSLPYHVGINGVDVFGLDSAWMPDGDLRESHDGRITDSQLGWLASRVESADCPIAFTHHNLPPTARQAEASGVASGIDMSTVPIMRNGGAVMETLAAAGVPLVLTGHIHLPGVAFHGQQPTEPAAGTITPTADPLVSRPTADSATVTEITAPSTCTFPQAYLLVDIDSRGTTVRYVPVASERESLAAYRARLDGTDVDRGQAALGAIRTAQFPLVEEWLPTGPLSLEPTSSPPPGSTTVDD
ncbi:metallophosphoesterase family protein [Halohasta litorea]|uniref:Metallophosphoesterase family protein n=1 Tax=Halohasta litorea TaxID=869891 RepID=A0ABD6DC69_9EURY|nr:metallophosphoesterase [Halohasta litorea]